jgi:hypothetical protein
VLSLSCPLFLSAAVFDTEVLEVVLDFKWQSYARNIFLCLAACAGCLAVNFSAYRSVSGCDP